MKTRVVVGFSGGVTSAWCAGWALRMFDRDDVTLLFHDTLEEDEDTYRFMREMADKLDKPVVNWSDGRSATQVFRDENAIANNRMAFCSRILKAEQRDSYFEGIRAHGPVEIINVVGFSPRETARIQRAWIRGQAAGYTVRFPLVEEGVTKQQTADWCAKTMGVRLPRMYEWSEHANCVGCVRGGKAYWLKVREHRPDVYEQRSALEREFGHTILKDTTLEQLAITGLKRKVRQRESIDIGVCECGS
jgi:hypothetical protein